MASSPRFNKRWVVRPLSTIARSGYRCGSPIPTMKRRKLAANTNHVTDSRRCQALTQMTDCQSTLSVKKNNDVRVMGQGERVLPLRSSAVRKIDDYSHLSSKLI